MNITSQSSPKAQYITPLCDSIALNVAESILVVSGNPGDRWQDGGAGIYGDDERNNNGEY